MNSPPPDEAAHGPSRSPSPSPASSPCASAGADALRNRMTIAMMSTSTFEMYVDAMGAGSPMVSVDPGYARKLLRDLAPWSQSIGFAPHRDFATIERIFGDVSADASDAVFRFGRDGKPFYVPGPNDTASLIQRRIAQLQNYLGDDGFGFETAA